MREIKFRAMAYMNTWVYGMPVFYENGEASTYYNTCPQYGYEATNVAKMRDKINPNTIGQYTGLKDKNGKESYCKDIFQTQTGTVFYIDWNPIQHRWSCYDKNNDCRFHLNEYQDFEIIGNIYQTPELLKDKGC